MSDITKVALDAMGGDNAPHEIIKGAMDAIGKRKDIKVFLVGQEEVIKKELENYTYEAEQVEVVNATEVIETAEPPVNAIRRKKQSSMVVGMNLVKNKEADAFVSAGSTGAIVVGGTLMVKRIKGVKRPALAGLIPSPDGHYMLMDMGANAECRPEMLEQFGVMASVYLNKVEGIDNPKIGLLNIGVEDSKGTELQKEAYKLLSEAPINFVGNIESREMPKGVCDAVITDGFTGNIALKLIEGTATTFFKMVKGVLYKKFVNKLAALILKKDLYALKGMMDSSEVGGAPLLGVKKPVIKAHGSSDAKALKNAIRQAISFTEKGVIDTISEHLS